MSNFIFHDGNWAGYNIRCYVSPDDKVDNVWILVADLRSLLGYEDQTFL
jgi:hypothetical protein